MNCRYVVRRIFAVLVMMGVATTRAYSSDLDVGIDIQAEHAHQEFSNDSANVDTIDLAPYLQYGNWELSVDAPWISADGNFVNGQFPQRAVNLCQRAGQNSRFARKHPNILPLCQSLGVTNADDKVSGMSDITAFVHYGMLLDDQSIWLLSFGAGYKFDNGDASENLGSDTRNTMLEVSLGANYGWFSGSMTGGYAFVDGGDETVDSSHYNYTSLDLGVTPLQWLTLGCTAEYDESYFVTADDVTKVTAYVKLKPWQHVRFKIYARDYGSAEGYPEREYGGSMSLVY